MHKQLGVLVVLLIALSVLLSACGGAATPAPAPAKAEPTQAAPAAATTKAPEPTKAPAAAATAAPAATKASEPTKASAAAQPVAAGQYKESPMLSELVKAGKLPPIEQRVPEKPYVVGPGALITQKDLPDWQPGKYGGTLSFAHAVANWNPDIFIMLNEHLLCAPGISLEGLKGCLAEEYKIENDNKEFTFKLRKGLKWSDGTPVTTEDVRFVWEDIYGNEKLAPTGAPPRFRDGGRPTGNPAKLGIIDDQTFKLTFGEPYGGFLREISIKGWQGYTDLLRPSHVLKQWHAKYGDMNSQKVKDELAKMNLKDEWWQLFNNKDCTNFNVTRPCGVGFPQLGPWVQTASGNPSLITFERNPFYWKMDNTGQQLPYVDKLRSQQVNDVEMVTMKVLNGEVDYVRESTALVKLPLYKENAAKANIESILMDMHTDPSVFYLNLTNKDENWRKVVSDLRFRQAVNYAINRKEIIESVYYGLGQLPQLVSGEYNLEKANQLLDEMGLNKKDAEGYRLGPDGKTFVIALEHGAHAPDIAPAAELVAQHLKKAGLKVTVKQIDPNLWAQRAAANDLQATIIWNPQPQWLGGTANYLPFDRWAPLWQLWYDNGGKKGEEPPAEIKSLYSVHEGRVKAVPYSDEDQKLVQQMYKLYKDNLWTFPLAEKVNYAMVASNKLGNMPKGGQAIGANYSGEQFFYK